MDDGKSSASQDGSLVKMLLEMDKAISSSLCLASSRNSKLGHLRPHMKWLEYSCHGLVWISGCIVCLWFTSNPSWRAFFLNLIIALIIDIVMVAVLKASLRRKRPPTNKDDMFFTMGVDKLSCPSGHTSRAVLMCLILIECSPSLYILHLLLVLWSACTCLSRVVLGRHYLGDVLVGVLLGFVEYKIVNLLWLGTKSANWLLRIFYDSDGKAVVDDL